MRRGPSGAEWAAPRRPVRAPLPLSLKNMSEEWRPPSRPSRRGRKPVSFHTCFRAFLFRIFAYAPCKTLLHLSLQLPTPDRDELEAMSTRERAVVARRLKNRDRAIASRQQKADRVTAALQERISALEAENSRLRSDLAASNDQVSTLRADQATRGNSAPPELLPSVADCLLLAPYLTDGTDAGAPGLAAIPPNDEIPLQPAHAPGPAPALAYASDPQGAIGYPVPAEIHVQAIDTPALGRSSAGGGADDELFPLVFTPFAADMSPPDTFLWSPTRGEGGHTSHSALMAWRSGNVDVVELNRGESGGSGPHMSRKLSAPAALYGTSSGLPI